MTKGIKIEWRYPGTKRVSEIEYFYGIDLDDLQGVPAIAKVPTFWPTEQQVVEYNVDVRHKWKGKQELRLSVRYDPSRNPDLSGHPELVWGTNEIVLRAGKQHGVCRWSPEGHRSPRKVCWAAFDLGASQSRPRSTYYGSKRQARFRHMILDCDGNRCVLTGEGARQALEAAHLVPAKNGENDMPSNGIALRADLHRLFDAGLFTFDENGNVAMDAEPNLSSAYRKLLRNKQLPRTTLKRVKATLGHPAFVNRQRSNR